MKKLINLSLVVLIAFAAFSCSSDDDSTNYVQQPEPGSQTIAELVNDSPTHQLLAAALAKAELVQTLDGDADEYTVLAPDNGAIMAFLDVNYPANVPDSLDAIPQNDLKEVLLNHVISGKMEATDFSDGSLQTLSTQGSLEVDTSEGILFNGASTMTQQGIQASNGIIHSVNTVIPLNP